MKRKELLEDFKKTINVWIAFHRAKCSLTTPYSVRWSDDVIQNAWLGYLAAYENYCKDADPLTGTYEDKDED